MEKTKDSAPSHRGVILLGIYLLIMTLLSVYVLGGLMMAETDEDKVRVLAGITPTPTPTATPTPIANANAAVNTGVNANTAANVNTNTGANVSANTPANVPVNGNAAARTNVNTAANANMAPAPTPTVNQNAPVVSIPPDVFVSIPLFFRSEMSADSYLFLVVFFSGMLGSVIRGIFSFCRYLGQRTFSFDWTWFYLSLPFAGAGLALVIYFVIRGGFYGASFGKGLVLNLFSFAALGAMTGLFSEHAMQKLREVATVLLADVPPKVDANADADADANAEADAKGDVVFDADAEAEAEAVDEIKQ